jgi:hypothetical protein
MSADSPIVEEVRARRCELSARFGHDLRAYCEHIRDVQTKHQIRIVDQVMVVSLHGILDEEAKREVKSSGKEL